jgi:hypothetical protein
MNQLTFTIYAPDGVTPIRQLRQREVEEFAADYNVESVAPGRISLLFKADLLMHSELNGIDPTTVLYSIRDLESGEITKSTKPATQFTREPLRGFWHKHFFSAHFVPQNIALHLQKRKLHEVVERVLDPVKYPVITKEAIAELTSELIEGSLEQRNADGKLTGEWIIFAKHDEQNYYLCMALHESGDDVSLRRMESICFQEFPFLQPRT